MAMQYIRTDFNMEYMFRWINKMNPLQRCKVCTLHYNKSYCSTDGTPCFFSKYFNPHSVSLFAILREAEWHFLQSGEYDLEAHEDTYDRLMNEWCTHFQIPEMQQGDELDPKKNGVAITIENQPSVEISIANLIRSQLPPPIRIPTPRDTSPIQPITPKR